eukprot:scaffold1361_cov165-Amphora_coffeaeformis.AAC.9
MVHLETVKHNTVREANFLVHQKTFHIRSLITRQLNNLASILVLLYGTVAGKILLERFADALNIQIICQTGYGCNTFTPTALLDTHVNLFFRRDSIFVTGVFERVCIRGLREGGNVRWSNYERPKTPVRRDRGTAV